ncbi:pyridine nucleotide-disulfide oxidoreductase family protein [Stylonychia lemnae]|uniref:Pyridine nucleotide-disulfide oxidoreductase family protein n=1 Tax=Stylonychia lemnae TaxID=5949 RepID=A0A078ABB5_STYLE|nr:pyridine nucleotide-disulfide oxidoreductase family protein [Stylonychia lemnae]|eukprot:CDW79590.1 pyridine nucleotide-disulfide oxidoreductase family protein [Stylonychia lemnae]
MQSKVSRIVCIGGGHCNVQVMKMLKQVMPGSAKMTLLTEAPNAYYSGMLPGAISHLYKDEDIQIQLKPLAHWCKADYIERRVHAINANENRIILEGDGEVQYDYLAVNVGSRTRGANETKGVKEHSLSTRPINDLLGKIEHKEAQLIRDNIIPEVVVCGGGAAGIEMAFGFKRRWSDLFKQEIHVSIISADPTVLYGSDESLRTEINRKFKEKNIDLYINGKVQEINENCVILADGRVIPCNVAVWATGAEPQKMIGRSNLDILNGYIRVNDNMQSTSHPNIFGGGDCVTMQTFAEKRFPPKAGVYAVRAGPYIAQNLANSINGVPLTTYVPQSGFLALLMTGDGKAIGSKFGIAFAGKWVWNMKDYIDRSFMKLFNPNYLFKDFQTRGYEEPLENNELFENEKSDEKQVTDKIRERINALNSKDSAVTLLAGEDHEEFFEQLFVLDRMARDEHFCNEVVDNFRQLKNK